ncbi:15201_t:CDS:2, partial [Rhizophagus irregularis]
SQNNNEDEESQNNNSSDEESQNNNEDEESQNNNSSDEESQNNNSSDEELQNDNSSDKDEESQINNSSDEESPNEDELQDYYMREIQEYEYNYDMQEVLFQDDESSGSLFLNNAVKLCKKLHLTNENIFEIQELLLAFYKHYEREYYCNIKERISTMKLKLFNHLSYRREIYNQIFPSQPPKRHAQQHLIYSDEYYLEEFYFPSKDYTLSPSELKKIKENLSTSYDIAGRNLDTFSKDGITFGRMLTKDKYFIGSKWIHKNNDWSRINYTVTMQIDKWARFKHRQPEYIKKSYYGIIEFFFLYNFDGQNEMLAYIHWTKPVTEDRVGTLSFSGFSYYDFIRVSAIDRCLKALIIEIHNMPKKKL